MTRDMLRLLNVVAAKYASETLIQCQQSEQKSTHSAVSLADHHATQFWQSRRIVNSWISPVRTAHDDRILCCRTGASGGVSAAARERYDGPCAPTAVSSTGFPHGSVGTVARDGVGGKRAAWRPLAS
jgi:hypothetical protein